MKALLMQFLLTRLITEMTNNHLGIVKNMKITIVLPIVLLFVSYMANGQTWTGNINNSWHNAGNWDSGNIPTSNSTVTIRSVAPKPFPVITQNVTVRTINLPDWSSGELTVTNGAILTVGQTFNINNHGKLILDKGTLQFNGNGNGSQKINMGWTNTSIHIKNKGRLISPDAQFDIIGEIHIDDGSMTLGNGMQLGSGKLIQVSEGEINVFGTTNIQGIVNGGNGKFIFNGNNNHEFTIKSGGRFLMLPSTADQHSANCQIDSPDNSIPSGGIVEVHTSANIFSSGYFHGGNASVKFFKSTSLSGTAVVETHNGELHFLENLTAGSAHVNITCKGTLKVDGATTLKSSSFLNAVGGTIYLGGNLRTESNSSAINAGNSTIYFYGNTFENEGYFNAETSTFIFNANHTQIVSTHNYRENITFYNLIAEGTAAVTATHNILVLNDMIVEEHAEFNVTQGKTLNVVGVVTGDPHVDTNRPYIISIRINSPGSITAIFNEPLNKNSAQNAKNYRIENENGQTINNPTNPRLGGTGNNEVTLTLGFNIVEDQKYYLISNNILNFRGYTTNDNHKKRFGLTEPVNTWRWAGTIDSNWDMKENWTKKLLPATNSIVIIPVTSNNPVISSSGIRISDLKIETGASLTIGSKGNLTVDNNIENHAGSAGLVIASDPEGTGSLIHNVNSVPATFQRYISGHPQDWQMLSSPVSNQAISGNFTPTGGDNPYGDGTRYDFYAWHEPDTSWVYLLNDYQQPTWQTANGSNIFIPGRGYLVSYKDEHPTKYFEGNLNNGPVTIDITRTKGDSPEFGQNLIGNPYPSSIDWKAPSGWNRNKLATTGGGYDVWIWSETHLNYGAYNSSSASDVGTLGVSRYIAPNQGFFIQASGNGVISMSNAVRSHQDAGNWLKNGTIASSNEYINIIIESADKPGRDEILVEFGHQEFETGTPKKFSFIPAAPALYVVRNNSYYSILMVGEKEKNAVLPLSFKPGAAGTYSFMADVPAGSFDYLELLDRQTGQRYNLLENPTITFQAGMKDQIDRFVVQVFPGHYADPHNSLPIEVFAGNNLLNIDMRLVTGEYTCKVYNLQGQLLTQKVMTGGDIKQLNIHVPASVVIVHILGSEGQVRRKVPLL